MSSRVYEISIGQLGGGFNLRPHSRVSRAREGPFSSELSECTLDDLYSEVTLRPRVAFPLPLRGVTQQLVFLFVEGRSNRVHVFAIHRTALG